MKDLADPRNTLLFMKRHHLEAKKKFAQNFLVDRNVLKVIIQGSGITKNDTVLEIGPGIGTLTQALCESAGRVLLVEIDPDMIPLLEENLDGFNNYEIIRADFLKLDLEEELHSRGLVDIKVCANLPYYITTPILMKFFKEHVSVKTITVMLQKEVARRMVAEPGGKDYGSLSLYVKYFSSPGLLLEVPKESFIPSPKVDSAVINLKMREKPAIAVSDEDLFFKFIKAVFAKRRKTLLNSLKNLSLKDAKNFEIKGGAVSGILSKLSIPGDIRGEKLSLAQYADIFNLLFEGAMTQQSSQISQKREA